jgi:hypothetical protein
VLLQRRVGRPRFVRLRMKILLGLRSEPVTTAPVGVAFLFGGVAEECLHLPNLLRVVSSG